MDPTTEGAATRPFHSPYPEMYRPPVNRAMRVLDRSFFKRTIPISAAAIFKQSDIGNVRAKLMASNDSLALPRMHGIKEIKKDGALVKAMLLKEGIKHDDTATWSPTINELVNSGVAAVEPYDLTLDYDYWNYSDIMNAVLPEELLEEAPHGFTQAGHIAHLNLREQFLPYKHLIAEVLLDKNPTVRTVIRKTEDVGSHSEFRTFPYEHLRGDEDMNVTQTEQNCIFKFDYSRVYWNSRLETEHRRLVESFNKGDMVCDVMAGVGPFAIPAGKKAIFVWANDLNPHGYEVMQDAVARNKVFNFVTPHNMDGREFIPWAAKTLASQPQVKVHHYPKARQPKKADGKRNQVKMPPQVYYRPTTIDHYVMNLPQTAIEFLGAFKGIYADREDLFTPYTSKALPMVHVYCFSGNSENEKDDHIDICNRLTENLGYPITLDDCTGGSGNRDIELSIHNVRLVSPQKQMFCASFRLPPAVAFSKD
ncbi:guanine(37)-N1-methyltransferase [Aspergillus karnatakaensis]|uniref:tRNA (guanine) methyltransferase n=1 Tax=Aspergillus karnatakaensis TaxID=1810916 RepID=UPI003CCD9DCC